LGIVLPLVASAAPTRAISRQPLPRYPRAAAPVKPPLAPGAISFRSVRGRPTREPHVLVLEVPGEHLKKTILHPAGQMAKIPKPHLSLGGTTGYFCRADPGQKSDK
jgi:hypothetical protein